MTLSPNPFFSVRLSNSINNNDGEYSVTAYSVLSMLTVAEYSAEHVTLPHLILTSVRLDSVSPPFCR